MQMQRRPPPHPTTALNDDQVQVHEFHEFFNSRVGVSRVKSTHRVFRYNMAVLVFLCGIRTHHAVVEADGDDCIVWQKKNQTAPQADSAESVQSVSCVRQAGVGRARGGTETKYSPQEYFRFFTIVQA